MPPGVKPMKLRRDAEPLSPAELIAVRRMLRAPEVAECMDAAEVARRLGLNKRTILDMARDGRLPGATKPFPNKVLIPVKAVYAWLEAHRVGSKESVEGRR